MERKAVSINKNIIYNSIGTCINLFLQWVITVLVDRISGVDSAGIWGLAMSLGNVFINLSVFGIKTYQVSDVKEKYSDRIYITSKFFSVALTIFVALIWVAVSDYDKIEIKVIILYMLYMMVFSFTDVFYGIQQRKWRLDIAGLSMCIRSTATFIVFCTAFSITKDLSLTLIFMLIISLVVFFIYDLPNTKKITIGIINDNSGGITNSNTFFKCIDVKKASSLMYECLPYAIYSLLHSLIITIPKLYLRGYYGKEDLGVFTLIIAPVTIIQAAAGFIINPLVTLFAIYYSENKKIELFKSVLKCISLLLGLLVLGLLGVKFLGKSGLYVLYGEDMVKYYYLLNSMVIVSVMTSLTILIGNLSIVIRDKRGINYSGFLGIIASFVSSIYYVKNYGIIGTNYALIISLGVQIIVFTVFIKQKC